MNEYRNSSQTDSLHWGFAVIDLTHFWMAHNMNIKDRSYHVTILTICPNHLCTYYSEMSNKIPLCLHCLCTVLSSQYKASFGVFWAERLEACCPHHCTLRTAPPGHLVQSVWTLQIWVLRGLWTYVLDSCFVTSSQSLSPSNTQSIHTEGGLC